MIADSLYVTSLTLIFTGINIILRDMRSSETKELSFKYDGGIKEYVKFLNKGKNTINANKIYPFKLLIFSTDMEPKFLKNTTSIAKPIAASAAATVKIIIANTCPAISPE